MYPLGDLCCEIHELHVEEQRWWSYNYIIIVCGSEGRRYKYFLDVTNCVKSNLMMLYLLSIIYFKIGKYLMSVSNTYNITNLVIKEDVTDIVEF